MYVNFGVAEMLAEVSFQTCVLFVHSLGEVVKFEVFLCVSLIIMELMFDVMVAVSKLPVEVNIPVEVVGVIIAFG